MQITRFVAALLQKQQHPRIPALPVQMAVIKPLLKRAAAAERRRTKRDGKLRSSHH